MAYADLGDTSIVVTTGWHEKDVIKTVPGSRYDGQSKTWRLPLSWGSCVALRGVFRDSLQISESLQKWAWNVKQDRIEPAMNLRHQLDFPLSYHEPHLYPFQRAGVEFIAYAGDVLLGDEMGAGKTVQALSALAHRIGAEQSLPALVICPNSVKEHWAENIRKFFPDATAYVVNGPANERRKIIESASGDQKAIVIINIEAARLFSRLAPYGSVRLKRCLECDKYGDENLKKAQCEVHAKELNGFGFHTVILDEAHRIKEPKSKQTRACWALMHDPSVRRRWAMTGTPLASHPGDLWSIMHGVAPYDFPTKSKFVDRYCLSSWSAFGALEIVGIKPETRDEFFAFFDPHFRRMLKSIVLDQLPGKIRETRYVDLTPKQRKMYKEISTNLFTYTDDGQLLITPNNLAATTRLSQLAASSVDVQQPDPDDPTSWVVTLKNPSPKLDEFEEILEDIGDVPCVAAAEQKQLINLAAERLSKLNIPYALITGDISEFERQRALRLLSERKIKVLLFTVKAGGVGLDMTAADTIIFLQRPWSMIHNVQTEGRVHRIGSEQHNVIRVIDIISRDTVEEKQLERLDEKMARLEEITRDRAALAKANQDTSTLDRAEQEILASHLGTPTMVSETQ